MGVHTAHLLGRAMTIPYQPFMAEWQKILKTEFTLKYDVVRARVRGFVCHNRLQMFTHALND